MPCSLYLDERSLCAAVTVHACELKFAMRLSKVFVLVNPSTIKTKSHGKSNKELKTAHLLIPTMTLRKSLLAASVGHDCLGTQKAHKHKHLLGISLPYWASLLRGLYGISLSSFLLMCFLGALDWSPARHALAAWNRPSLL